MAVTTASFPELLWPGLRYIYGTTYNKWPELYTKVFEIQKSTMAFEKVQQVTGFGLAGQKDQNDSIPYTQPYQGGQVEFVNTVYGLGTKVTREMYDDDQYRYINSLPKLLARSMRETEEVIAWNYLNRGFNTAYTGGIDNLTLFNTAHTLVRGGTYSNRLATDSDLNQTSLETAIQNVHDFVDDAGLKVYYRATTLIVPTALEIRAKKILNSTQVTGSNDNDVNVIKGSLNLVVSPYLTDPDAWFLKTDCPHGLVWFWRRRTEATRDGDHDTQVLKFATTQRHSQGWVDPRAVYGTPGE